MNLRSTLDRRRRRAATPDDAVDLDDGYEYEYVYVDEDDEAWDDEAWDDEPWDDDLEGEGHDAAADHHDGSPPVDPRIAARRDDVAQARRLRLRRRLIALAAVLAVILLAGAVTRSALLDVDEVTVSGADRSDPAALVAAAGIPAGTPLLGLDLDRAVAGVRSEPWVLDATIDHTWSGDVSITVVERTPVATVNAGAGGWLLVDAQRRVLAASPTPPDLPLVDGVGSAEVGAELDPAAQGAIDVAGALTPGVRSRVAVVRVAGPDDIDLDLQPTGTVRFGPATDLDERLRTLQTVFARVDLVCVDTIDLAVPDKALLTRVPACA